jgi:hypothetical protein
LSNFFTYDKYKIKILLAVSCLSFVLCSCKKEVFTGTTEIEKNGTSKIYVNSNPNGATIYLNGKNMGLKTPDSLTWLANGHYTITLKLNLFKDVKLTTSLNDNDQAQLYYNYYDDLNNFGKIYCSSSPSAASLILNDSVTSLKTPVTISQLFPGEYKVKLTLDGCRADSSIITVYGGRTTNTSFVMDDTTQWVRYRITNCLIPSNYISQVLVDKKNTKWIGTLDKGLASFDGKDWKVFNKSNSSLVNDFIGCMLLDNSDRLWIGTPGGLVSFDGSVWTNYTSYLPHMYVSALAKDKSGNIWIGTQGGLVKFNGSSWKTYQTSNSAIAANFVTALACDDLNRMWIGTNAYGINVFDGTEWKLYNMKNMQTVTNVGNCIGDIAIDKNGIVWVAHIKNEKTGDLGGVSYFNGSTWSVLTMSGMPTDATESIYVDSNNYKWIGTKSGLAKYESAANIKYYTTTNSKLPASQIEAVVIDENGDLYVGSWGGGLGKAKKGNY